MLLQNLKIIGQDETKHISIIEDKIWMITSDQSSLIKDKNELNLVFEKALAFPGLINSHDHLDFDLFPRTGNRIYNSYIEWGADIQLQNRNSIDAILEIPKQLRVEWGIYKNLLCGITSVVNHGEWLDIKDPLINVLQDSHSLHSVRRERSWKFKLNRPFAKDQPFVIHTGEGTDKASFDEINKLIRWNLFKRKLVAVHGVSMNAKQAQAFEALIWCPASNFFLLNATAKINELRKQTKIIFGTDSTLTAPWNIWEHLRLARDTKLVTDAELFDMLTINPAKTWSMNDAGQLAQGKWADIIIAKPGRDTGEWDRFYNLKAEELLLILHHGNIRLFDEELLNQVKTANIRIEKFSKVYINGIGKYIRGDLPGLMKGILKYKPDTRFPVEFD